MDQIQTPQRTPLSNLGGNQGPLRNTPQMGLYEIISPPRSRIKKIKKPKWKVYIDPTN